MSLEFDSIDNKGLLWNLMYENGMFTNISPEQVENVKQAFENIILNIEKNNNHLTLSEKNKKALISMNESRESFVKVNISNPITAEEIANERKNIFNKKFEEKQKEFSFDSTQPNEINFSDKFDGPIGSEMDDMVANAIAKREQELNIALQSQDTPKGDKWINKDNPRDKHIKIGEQLNDKHVTFNIKKEKEQDDKSTNFLSMLKKNPRPKKELSIDDKLRIIERNQTSIMNILSNILEILQSN